MNTPREGFDIGFKKIGGIFGIHIWKHFNIPTVIEERGFIENRIIILSIELFGWEFFIDYIKDYERIIEVE